MKSYLGDAFREEPELFDNSDFDKPPKGFPTPKAPHNYAISAVAFRKLFLDGLNPKKGTGLNK